MINVVKEKKEIIITGHANYDTYGKDIVCASVSSIVITTVNAILEIDRDSLKYKEEKDKLTIEIRKEEEIVLKLIFNMMNLLKEVSKDYPKNIKIREEDE